MKVRNSKGELKELVIKANDSIPQNAIIDFDGDVVPEGYEKVEEYSRSSASVNSSNLSSVERNECLKFGKIVVFYFTATAKVDLENTAELFFGLPIPVINIRAIGVNAGQNNPIRFGINTEGKILNQYSQATIKAGNVIEGQIVYISK
mgnify:CR=1 FL=1